MGVKISDLITTKELDFDNLSHKVLAVDAFNMLYQFITTIRQPDGSPLTDTNGKTTSHLIGLFYRLTNLLKRNIKLVFVFDGKRPEPKKAERERRKRIKDQARLKYESAIKKQDIEGMKKYASRTVTITEEIIEESKLLMKSLGIPCLQAPSEGEAQAAHLVFNGDAYAVMSQDADALLFGGNRVIKNLSISQRRKRTGTLSTQKTVPEIIDRDAVLKELGINQEQLIVLGILVGTDFNPGGIKGIGPKNALKLVKKNKDDFERLFEDAEWSNYFDYPWQEVFDIFSKMDVTDDYELRWNRVNVDEVKKILVEDHDFSDERVSTVLKDLDSESSRQKDLNDFFSK